MQGNKKPLLNNMFKAGLLLCYSAKSFINERYKDRLGDLGYKDIVDPLPYNRNIKWSLLPCYASIDIFL